MWRAVPGLRPRPLRHGEQRRRISSPRLRAGGCLTGLDLDHRDAVRQDRAAPGRYAGAPPRPAGRPLRPWSVPLLGALLDLAQMQLPYAVATSVIPAGRPARRVPVSSRDLCASSELMLPLTRIVSRNPSGLLPWQSAADHCVRLTSGKRVRRTTTAAAGHQHRCHAKTSLLLTRAAETAAATFALRHPGWSRGSAPRERLTASTWRTAGRRLRPARPQRRRKTRPSRYSPR